MGPADLLAKIRRIGRIDIKHDNYWYSTFTHIIICYETFKMIAFKIYLEMNDYY